jgi:hypothetical protein
MRKLLCLQFAALFLCAMAIHANAQDSVIKAAPAKKQVVKPEVKQPGASAAKPAGYYKPKYYNYRKPGDTTKHVYQRPVTDTAHKSVTPDVATDRSLNGQYQYLLTKIYNYQQPLLNAFHKSIMDTLKQSRIELKTAQAKIASENKLVDSLQNQIKTSDQSLNASNAKVDAIDMFGIMLPKSTYNLIMWGLVVVFGAIAGIVIVRSGSYSREAKYRVQLYNELDEEYKNYKIKANEKEKKLARELQTERNKLDDLLGGGKA